MQSPSVWSKLSPLANEERRGERGTTLSPGAKPLSLFGDAHPLVVVTSLSRLEIQRRRLGGLARDRHGDLKNVI